MKCPWLLLAVLAFAALAPFASAQDPTELAPPTQVLIPAIALPEPAAKSPLDNSVALQFGIGFPFEARVDFPFGASGRHYYEAELEADAFVGPLPVGAWAMVAAGAGGRVVFDLFSESSGGGLMIAPGFQVLYAESNTGQGVLLGPDVLIGLTGGIVGGGVDLGVLADAGSGMHLFLPRASLYLEFRF